MSARKYDVPPAIKTQCDQAKYVRWLHRKAMAHVKRDRKRGIHCAVAEDKSQIHDAVVASGGLDFYTGEPLNWSLISQYDNEVSRLGRAKYKRTLAYLPTVDHTTDADGGLMFVICSWYVNDAKSDLSLDDFYGLCERVLKHCENLQRKRAATGQGV